MPKKINQSNFGTPIVDQAGRPTQEFYRLIDLLTGLEMIDDSGSPEGVVNAVKKSLYLDTSANKVYVKTTDFGDDTGWVVLN